MKILYGTGNEAKLASMKRCLNNLDIDIIGLKDVDRDIPQVEENGKSPLENARIKAMAYYKAFHIPVFSCDSGLYFEGLSAEIQPGVHVRNVNGKYLTDEEMIVYYSDLAKKHGDMVARYKNAICMVMDEHTLYESMADELSGNKFMITSKPHHKRVKGFPIDSLSIHISTREYYYDLHNYEEDEVALNRGFQMFFKNTLGFF